MSVGRGLLPVNGACNHRSVDLTSGGRESLDSDALSVTAHGLLNPMSCISGYSNLLLHRWDSMADADRVAVLRTICRQAAFVSETLGDLARGVPSGAGGRN